MSRVHRAIKAVLKKHTDMLWRHDSCLYTRDRCLSYMGIGNCCKYQDEIILYAYPVSLCCLKCIAYTKVVRSSWPVLLGGCTHVSTEGTREAESERNKDISQYRSFGLKPGEQPKRQGHLCTGLLWSCEWRDHSAVFSKRSVACSLQMGK